MYTRGLQSKGEYTTELAVFKGEDRTLKPVTGLPSEDVLSAYGNIPYNENGYICRYPLPMAVLRHFTRLTLGLLLPQRG